MLGYVAQDSGQTLAEALREYRAAHPGLDAPRTMSAQARAFFAAHDAAHVVFGCTTSLDDEAAVKIASVLGTTAGLGVLHGYGLRESARVYRRLTAVQMIGTAVRSAWIVPRVAWSCLRQSERWPWGGEDRFGDVPLVTLRRRFGIRVVGRSSAEVNAGPA